MWNELYGNSEKSSIDLIYEFAIFSHEQMNKLLEIENKLSIISLEFKASATPINIEELEKNLDLVIQKLDESIGSAIERMNSEVDTYHENYFNKDRSGMVRAGSRELKEFLKITVDQFKEENKKMGETQKTFIRNFVNTLIRSKVEKMKSGELPPDAFNRSDFFTDEEMNSITEAQAKVISDAIENRKKFNINTVNDMTQKFIGVSGKENILKKMDEFPESTIVPDLKGVVEKIWECALMCEKEQKETPREENLDRAAIANALCLMLEIGALGLSLEDAVKISPKPNMEKDDVYRFCNSNMLAHFVTGGFCSAYTIGKQLMSLPQIKKTSKNGMVDVLSGLTFMMCLLGLHEWTWKALQKFFQEAILSIVIDKGCEFAETHLGMNNLSIFCSIIQILKGVLSVAEAVTKAVGGNP